MALSEDRLQQIILNKDIDAAQWGEAWAIIDGVMVIYDCEDEDSMPAWLAPVLDAVDDDGNTPFGLPHAGST